MKTQISRDSFQPEQRYSGVYLQQGRMILDADWNELTDIQKARLADALRDVISGTLKAGGSVPGGAPRVGGLRIYADPKGNICIQPGVLYVEGVPAKLDDKRLDNSKPFGIDNQAEYPLGADFYGENLKLYADVWERTVTALERKTLMDAALHGADTATRSQTMLQVKWCNAAKNPLDEAFNPPQGNALLTLRLRSIASSGDLCDPCASQVTVDERLGNYLFRVEVHDYDPNTRWLTLKWSRDNGAEACAVASAPPSFKGGDWVWEYFDDDTERLLGNHFASNPKKLRGSLKTPWSVPTGQEPKTYARQWDGALKINLDSGNIESPSNFPSRDRGVTLVAGDVNDQAHGRVNFTGGVLKINLELMELELATGGKFFVPGDYWQAEVREAEDESGDTVLAGSLPRGIRHHYLFLGELNADKQLIDQDGAFQRRMAFPPLTDITAADASYAIPAVTGLIDSVRKRLPSIKDLPDGERITLQAVLDYLLRELDARAIPYRTDGEGGKPVSIADLMVKKTGDTMTGALTIDPTPALPATSAALTVNGNLKLQAEPTTPDKAILSYDKPTGFAKWIETSLTAWQLTGGNLSTDPGSVTGSITIGSPETEALYVAANGRIGIGTTDPQAQLHLVTLTSDTAGDSPAYGMKWLWGQHIADGATQMWALHNAYGRLITWDRDSLFVGLQNAGVDRKDAVIAWGDNLNDNLRFLFTLPTDAVPPREIMRLVPDGSVRVGGEDGAILAGGGELGALFAHNLAPNADGEVEALDDGPYSGIHAHDGGLSFHTSLGDFGDPGGGEARMFIDPRGNVGIGTTETAKARLVVEGDIYVSGKITQGGQAMVLASKELNDISLGQAYSILMSLGGTTLRLVREAEVKFGLALLGLQGNIRLLARLHRPGSTEPETLLNDLECSGQPNFLGFLVAETTRRLSPGFYALEACYTLRSGHEPASIKTVSMLVTEVESPDDGQATITCPTI